MAEQAVSGSMVVWKCPVCGDKRHSEWALFCHIGGMAYAYREAHHTWGLEQVPNLNLRTPIEAAHELRKFARSSIQTETIRPSRDLTVFVEAYKLLAQIEIDLHTFVISRLKQHFGDDEKDWWVRGVPNSGPKDGPNRIRGKCATSSEEDPKRLEKCFYLSLGDLKAIMEKQWEEIFKTDFQRINPEAQNNKLFLEQFERLKKLRNEIMHPLRGQVWDDSDFQFVRRFAEIVGELTG